MAGISECFSIGSIVHCVTCYDAKIEGEVLAFDHQTNMLIIKSEPECPSDASTKLNDVYIVNLSLIRTIDVKKDACSKPDPPQSINLQKLSNRVRNQVEQKKRLVSALKADVSPEAQNLFMTIAKTINNNEVTWQGKNIVVFNDVMIKPPYKTENVFGDENSNQVKYVKKLVTKFGQDQKFQDQQSQKDLSSN